MSKVNKVTYRVGDVIEMNHSFDDWWKLCRITRIEIYSPINSGREPLYHIQSLNSKDQTVSSSYCYLSEIVRKVVRFTPSKTTLEFCVYAK